MFGLMFLQPAFLLAGLAAGVPILIHLINRHRALVHRFPALRFLLMADRRTARKFRLYQLLLLALRVLAILLLALLLSQPRWGDEASAALALPPQATVLLVDNSLSMQFRDGQETRLERAKTLAGQLLDGIAAPDSAVVLPLVTDDADTDAKPPLLGADAAALWDQVRAISASHAAVDIAAAVQRAIEILQASTAPRRRLMLLTDLTVHGWEGFRVSDLPRVPEDLVVHVIRLGSPQRDANALISGVRVTEPPFIEQTPLDVTVWVRNHSDEPVRSLRVDLLLGGETVGQQLADLAADEEVAVPFRIVAPQAGLHWGEVRLQGDAFTEDDRFYVALQTVAPARGAGGGRRSGHVAVRQRDVLPAQCPAAARLAGVAAVPPEAADLGGPGAGAAERSQRHRPVQRRGAVAAGAPRAAPVRGRRRRADFLRWSSGGRDALQHPVLRLGHAAIAGGSGRAGAATRGGAGDAATGRRCA